MGCGFRRSICTALLNDRRDRMNKMMKSVFATLRSDTRGVTAVEYAIVAGALITALAGVFTALGTHLTTYISGLTF
jgi:Flp pilus assembly pilin Flp